MRWGWLAVLAAVGLGAAGPALGQNESNPPCSSSAPHPGVTLSEPGSSTLYATHALRLEVPPNSDGSTSQVKSASAPGAHFVRESDDEPFTVFNDKPGPFTVTAVVNSFESNGSPCDSTASTTVQLASPARSNVSKLKRPGYLVRKRKLYKPNPTFSFTVKPDKSAPDRRPFTVRARISHRFRLPGKGVKSRTKVYFQRRFESGEPNSVTYCKGELLCPRRSKRGFMKELELDVKPHLDDGLATKGIKVIVKSPAGYPADRALKFFQTPWGVDLQVFQAGRRLARFRAVGRCSGGGQSSRCRFKKVSLAR